MCTVTLAPIPGNEKGFILTSNRDEAVLRQTFPPEIYDESGISMLYPKDKLAGGTWIGLSDRSRAICLLNGGFEKHRRNPPYRKSRGLVVKDLLAAEEIEKEINAYDLENIEPFTAVLLDWKQQLEFRELVWDGKQKHLKNLPKESRIWASTLLYSTEEIDLRKSKFQSFKEKYELNSKNLLKFHSSEGKRGEEGFIINRGFLKTCSITQITKSASELKMWYRDLSTDNFRDIETLFSE